MQRSVFGCRPSPVELANPGCELRGLIEDAANSARCNRLDGKALWCVIIYAIGTVTSEPSHWLV